MDFSLILQNINKYIQLEATEIAFFTSLLEYKKYKKKQFALKLGEISKSSIFVTSGCLRSFSIDKNGFEHILSFAPPDWWIADMYSLITQKPCNLFIEAVEETECLLLPKEKQEILYQEIPKFERFFRILIEKSLVASQQRTLDNLSLTAEERYENFCKRYPSLVNCLPQKYLASYIGVTPEFFSKMRKKLLRK
jgi:CRP-like cAMP-binding protein